MFSYSSFEIVVLLSIFLRHVIAVSNPHPDFQTGSDSSSSLDLHPHLGFKDSSAEPAQTLPTNGDYAFLLSEQASSPLPLGNGDNTGSLIRAESDGCSSTPTQLSNKMRRAKRDKGVCDAIQDTKKSDPIIQPGQKQGGGQENDGRTTPSSKNSPSPIPIPQHLKSGGADELCLRLASYYRVCAPAYLESKTRFIHDLDQCRPYMGLECNKDESSFCCSDIRWNQPSLPSLSLPLFTTAFYTHKGYACESTVDDKPGQPSQSTWYWPF